MILNPTQMGFVEWTNQLTLQLDKYGSTMKLQDIKQWRDWAVYTLQLIGLSPVAVNPYSYEQPVDWAVRFTQDAEFLLNG